MNLYRSFGNLLEAWVTEGSSCPDSEWLGNNTEDSPTPSSDMGANLRSESVDSGVETSSSDMSFLATSSSVSTDNADLFTPQNEGVTPASTSESPLLSPHVPSSSSSLHLCPIRAEKESSAIHLKVEQALQRTESKCQKDNPNPLSVDEVLRRRPRASFLPKRHTSEIVRGQRSESSFLRWTANTSVPVRQMSEMLRRPQSMRCDKQRQESCAVEQRTELSPGLCYLEQVCKTLEEIARRQMHNRGIQFEMDALWEHEDMQAADTCQSDFVAVEEEPYSCQRFENENAENPRSCSERKQQKYGHFRQRSASDTTIATLHLKKLSTDCRGQHLSANDLLEKEEEHHEKQSFQGLTKEETNNKKSWRLKIGSLRREQYAVSDTKSQQMQSSEKKSTRRRLSQLFKRRGKSQ